MFHGIHTAIITPFSNGSIDRDTLAALIERQLKAGIHGIMLFGTTGESPVITEAEREEMIPFAKEIIAGRALLTVGAGTNNTHHAIEMSRQAERLGADALLHVTPYYNKPTPRSMLAHYQAIAEASKLPLVVYNVPGRTGVNLAPSTSAMLAENIPSIKAIKEASGNIEQNMDLVRLLKGKINLLSGDDPLFLPQLSIGFDGLTSVISNLAPARTLDIYNAFQTNDLETARTAHLRLLPLIRAMFSSTSPLPVKSALVRLGLVRDEFRLPLVGLTEAEKQPVFDAMDAFSKEAELA